MLNRSHQSLQFFPARLLRVFLLWGVLVALGAIVRGETPVPADQAFADFEKAKQVSPPDEVRQGGRTAQLRWHDATQQELVRQGLALYASYPADPRRWEVVLFITQSLRPTFVKEIGPDFATVGMKAVTIDQMAAATWAAKSAELTSALNAAGDVPPSVREAMDWGDFAEAFRATSQAKAKGEPYDYSGFRARFDAHAAKYAGLDVVADRAADYLGALEGNQPGASNEVWKHLLEAPNAALRAKAGERMKLLEVMSKPLEIAFTAADGRAVDLKNLRGKVVLVDFWATWCGPCKEEIPNVKKAYTAYHDKGFEVVGIALENGKLTAKDTPAQTAAKLAAAKKVLTDFTAANDMPWPQYFDGKYWKNDLSTRFGIAGIPAMFLLDQNGKVVSTNARGEALEREVKRLLKL